MMMMMMMMVSPLCSFFIMEIPVAPASSGGPGEGDGGPRGAVAPAGPAAVPNGVAGLSGAAAPIAGDGHLPPQCNRPRWWNESWFLIFLFPARKKRAPRGRPGRGGRDEIKRNFLFPFPFLLQTFLFFLEIVEDEMKIGKCVDGGNHFELKIFFAPPLTPSPGRLRLPRT